MSLKGLDLASEPKKEPSQLPSEGVTAGRLPVQERKPAEMKVIKPKWLKM